MVYEEIFLPLDKIPNKHKKTKEAYLVVGGELTTEHSVGEFQGSHYHKQERVLDINNICLEEFDCSGNLLKETKDYDYLKIFTEDEFNNLIMENN